MQYDATTQTQLEDRRGTDARVLLWIRARNRETGLPEVIGFWSGDDHQEFLIDGELRTYFGAGNVIGAPPIIVQPGFMVRNYRLKLPPFTDEVKTLMQTYEPRLAEVELHSCPLDIDTGAPLGTPLRRFKGFLNQAPEERKKGGVSYTELVMVSHARLLTFGLPLKRSSAELQRRNPADRGREYIDTTAQWTVSWGG
ncbi:hypothetical protein [Phaeobacter sp. HF9A]|uniref:hypothetical protein n=1 Tax=Phaeobacter sp. HF9A TaxID=2721561 RepID=UPI001430A7F5|nr:hypothetical protein [Phaeobacter sp. HF9A]NIZ12911.1 hypothetical protein [Phaeobacter sp. HF9A]